MTDLIKRHDESYLDQTDGLWGEILAHAMIEVQEFRKKIIEGDELWTWSSGGRDAGMSGMAIVRGGGIVEAMKVMSWYIFHR